LRPLKASEILDEAVELYKKNAWLYIGIAAILYIPTMILDPTVSGEHAFMYAQDLRGMTSLFISLAWYLLIAGPIVTGALTYAVSECYLGRSVNIRQCFAEVMKWRILSNMILSNLVILVMISLACSVPGLLLVLGLTLLMSGSTGLVSGIFVLVVAMISVIIPVYISARLALAVPSIVLERNNVTTALRRTQKLTLHRAGRIFGVIFLVLIVTSIIQGLIAAPSSYAMAKSLMEGSGTPLLIKIINSALQVITSAVLMPAGSIVTLLLYFDCRIRDEGYDLQVLAEEIASLNNENMNL
jgi:hypothetical protein